MQLVPRQTLSLPSLILLVFFIGTVGCVQKSSTGDSQQSSFSFTEEPAFCTQIRVFSNPVLISSKAQYFARQVTVNGLMGPGPAQDIKYAEVEVLDSQGTQIQCGSTDGTGAISLQIPQSKGNFRLHVLSRASNSYYQASVLNSPHENLPYILEQQFTLDGVSPSATVPNLVATHDGSLLGGAFNILDQIFKINSYLRSNTLCASRGNVCPQFTVAPPIRIFWAPGLSPYAYYGHPTSPISFFTKKDDPAVGIRRGLYIQGGLQGDVNCSDTDHFDNSVIIHEYGHFLEDTFAHSDSPGGSHNGNFIIDPRLAWSEGWANFFQTAVNGASQYRDTIGNSSCAGGTYLAVNLNLDSAQAGQDRMLPGTPNGEGVFREVSVSRELYHTMSSTATNGAASLGFPFIWKIFSDSQSGFRNSNVHFRNIGLFNQLMRSLVVSNDSAHLSAYDSVVSYEYQLSNQSEYALPVSAQPGATCNFNLQGVADTYSIGNYYSNLLQSNDFFAYYYDGSNPVVDLHYSGANPSDLDLDIYQEDYVYDDPSTMIGRSHLTYPENAGSGFETVNLSGAAPGLYLINVRVNTSHIGNSANYYLTTSSGVRLCP